VGHLYARATEWQGIPDLLMNACDKMVNLNAGLGGSDIRTM
jgi:hypothetical protein